jgi:hypothetical protein
VNLKLKFYHTGAWLPVLDYALELRLWPKLVRGPDLGLIFFFFEEIDSKCKSSQGKTDMQLEIFLGSASPANLLDGWDRAVALVPKL